MTSVSILDLPANMQSKIRVTDRGCWEWTGAVNKKGYGNVGHGGSTQLTHRVSWMLLVGPIPEHLEIDHRCRNTSCCFPGHLEPVTRKVNQERKLSTHKSHCKHGHAMTPENTIIKKRPKGLIRWNCRECERQAQRRRRAELARIASE